MSETILCVDDDPNILAGFRRAMHGRFAVRTAVGGGEGLALLAAEGPFAVVVSDMQMPEMNGIEFLSRVKAAAPDTVRMMLTGNTDLQTAIGAVNTGHIFRFLAKPCDGDTMAQAMEAGLAQYRLIVAEKQLLNETLNAGVRVLTDMLSLVNPVAFGRASRVRRYVKSMVARLGLGDAWQYEMAAMLSQIGCIGLPAQTLERASVGEDLTEEERRSYAAHPGVGRRLIEVIPRLEQVAIMIARQMEPCGDRQAPDGGVDPVLTGARLLKTAIGFDQALANGLDTQAALAHLRSRPREFAPDLVALLASMEFESTGRRQAALGVRELDLGMILEQDVRGKNGTLLIGRGQEVTYPILLHLDKWASGIGIPEPIHVSLSDDEAAA